MMSSPSQGLPRPVVLTLVADDVRVLAGLPIGSFKKGFEQVLNEAGVLRGPDGKKRVPYSLRHTCATVRISEGVRCFSLQPTWERRALTALIDAEQSCGLGLISETL
jgi:hypothetical protein